MVETRSLKKSQTIENFEENFEENVKENVKELNGSNEIKKIEKNKSNNPNKNSPKTKVGEIFLFVPNIIGYSRIVLACISLIYMSRHPKLCTVLYGLSCLLDALDGYAARKLNQSTSFGAVLDMVTDRCTTSCLIVFLSCVYPKFILFFQFLISLDLASHYMHMVAMNAVGETSHKSVKKESSRLLNLYYSNKNVLFLFCAANELFFVGLYLASFPLPTPPWLGEFNGIPLSYRTLIIIITFPGWLIKQFINGVQLCRAALVLANLDCEKRNRLE